MSSRSWFWLKNRIAGLLNAPRIFTPSGHAVPATRLGWQLNPPDLTSNHSSE